MRIIDKESQLSLHIPVSSLRKGMLKRRGPKTMPRKKKKRQEQNKCLVLKAGEESGNQESIKLWETRGMRRRSAQMQHRV